MKIDEFSRHYKDSFPVGEGWKPLVEKLVGDIIKIDPDVEVTQVKEKFGGLRFYVSGANDQVYDLIEQAEAVSLKICEECGTGVTVTTKPVNGWILTLCRKCRKARK